MQLDQLSRLDVSQFVPTTRLHWLYFSNCIDSIQQVEYLCLCVQLKSVAVLSNPVMSVHGITNDICKLLNHVVEVNHELNCHARHETQVTGEKVVSNVSLSLVSNDSDPPSTPPPIEEPPSTETTLRHHKVVSTPPSLSILEPQLIPKHSSTLKPPPQTPHLFYISAKTKEPESTQIRHQPAIASSFESMEITISASSTSFFRTHSPNGPSKFDSPRISRVISLNPLIVLPSLLPPSPLVSQNLSIPKPSSASTVESVFIKAYDQLPPILPSTQPKPPTQRPHSNFARSHRMISNSDCWNGRAQSNDSDCFFYNKCWL